MTHGKSVNYAYGKSTAIKRRRSGEWFMHTQRGNTNNSNEFQNRIHLPPFDYLICKSPLLSATGKIFQLFRA